MHRPLPYAALFAVAAFCGSAHAQFDFTGVDFQAVQRQWAAGQQQQMDLRQRQIVHEVMQNPRAQALYRQHRAQGGRLSFEQFAYEYAARGGFTPEGERRYAESQRQIVERESAALRGLRAAEARRGAAQSEQVERFYEGQRERGTLLRGQSTYVNPRDGRTYALPHTLQPQTFYHDHGSGRDFYFNEEGDYEFADE